MFGFRFVTALAAAFVCALLIGPLSAPAAAQCAIPFNTTAGYGSPTVQSPGSANCQPPAWSLHALHPLDDGTLGSYAKAMTSGTMAAGLAAGSPIFSFRYGGASVAIIRRIRFSIGDVVAFAAGAANFQGFVARAFTASDTGGTAGTLTGNNGKLRTSFGTTGVADFRIANTGTLTAGTRTLDSDPFAALSFGPVAAAGGPILAPTALYEPKTGEYPLVLATNEGFVIQANVPGTGTWPFSVGVEWDEVPAF